ncbi:hypothetical protein SAMN06265338_101854 [Rhodoblastus acidophilus]|uniref:Uncharacterized protein n=1 Tax=Rhodoblastus acidophilus TaxID=1074 RepID=A0A212QMK0_RHOAC|nr:hypothetical protein [Rhodoblastus acidophilus]MCW2317766.1 hypothetical protein [Rhodoblastus acidophilus]PPQ38861.1 hypothetical protein CKO16_07915 [Rhodoblastus acidophilus]RAI18013.1 hypothetical protein CH337_15050 [Rhodoblastus acidophilus]SNB60574.1 hypothetical protein SAMN06265338_101854 [Rhodoblastus acidophilus]
MVRLNYALGRLAIFALGSVVLTAAAQADCNQDIAAFGQKRNAAIQKLNAISKAHGGKLDPVEACPALRSLNAVEGEMGAYLVKNKDWCNIPDDFLNQFKAGTAKTGGMASQACALAAKVKQMQQNGGGLGAAAAPPPVKLPAGPL